uniref:Uncharacterized protein n=1 Tax=Panagrolaimus davidi TaxID=227884 RepID=A0A914R4C7_9BILA
MQECLDFGVSSSSPNIFAYIQKKNGLDKLHVYTANKGPKEIVFKRNQKDEVLLEIITSNQRYEIVFEGVKYLALETPSAIKSINNKPVIIEVTVDIPYMEYPILPPPNLSELPLTECSLNCHKCGEILAAAHPDHFVVLEQAEEIMETAMGCCRCCSSSAEAHKCEHIRSPNTGKIFIDDGCVLVTEDYLKKNSYIRLAESPLIQCLNCYQKSEQSSHEYFGFQRYPSKHIEILPMQADFIDKSENLLLKNLYKCWGTYFSSQLISTGLDGYVMITDGYGNLQFQLGFFFRRLLTWFFDAETKSARKITALCFFYTQNHTVMQKDLNTKIRLPKTVIKMFEKYLEKSHEILKPFTPGCGQWKVIL